MRLAGQRPSEAPAELLEEQSGLNERVDPTDFGGEDSPLAGARRELWHVLQMSDVLDLEFAMGLAEGGPVTLWEPQRSFLPHWPGLPKDMQRTERSRTEHPNLRTVRFPVLRGAARLPFSLLERMGPALLGRLLAQSPVPARSVLVCTTPYFAAVAEGWPGPVVYWLTDLMAAYEGIDPEVHRRLDRRLCRRAELVCPNSERIATYLREQAGCPENKIEVIPNANRACNTLPAPLWASEAPAPGMPAVAGPVAGIMGALGGNMDWVYMQRLQALTPWLRWVFVGPTELRVEEPAQRRARRSVLAHPGSTFTGPKPYRDLYRYARAFTVAVLPYSAREPTFSGSSTRFYEHLAACHPMLATPGVAELLQKQPLVRLAATAEEAACVLEAWRRAGFDDGQREARWQASRLGTWTERGRAMRAALAARLGVCQLWEPRQPEPRQPEPGQPEPALV